MRVDLHCLKCGAENIKGASETIVVENGRATCDNCGNVFKWPPRKGSQS